MNLPNKITCVRLVISLIVLIILCLPWSELGVEFPIYNIFGVENVDLKYIICGILFLIGSVTDFLDGYIARKYNLVTDKFIPLIVPVIIITRDIVVDSIKMASGSKGKVVAASWPGKIKTICMMIGLTLVFFYNIPFAFIGHGLRIDYLFVYVATIMSIVSACQYYLVNKDFIFTEM